MPAATECDVCTQAREAAEAAQAAKQEQQERQQQEEAAARARRAQDEEAALAAQREERLAKAAAVPPEPERKSDGTQLVVKMPDGQRLSRRFPKTCRLQVRPALYPTAHIRSQWLSLAAGV